MLHSFGKLSSVVLPRFTNKCIFRFVLYISYKFIKFDLFLKSSNIYDTKSVSIDLY
jgi:hypothetical protein